MPESEKSAEYIKGYEQGVRDFAEKVKKYYASLNGNTYSSLVAYTIEQLTKALIEGVKDDVSVKDNQGIQDV